MTPGPGQIFADFAALEQMAVRLATLARSLSCAQRLELVSAAATGDVRLADEYEAFRSKWLANRRLIVDELDAATRVVREAALTYQGADRSIAGGGDA